MSQFSNSTFKTFGIVRQKCQSLLEFFNTITHICNWPHTFSDIFGQNWNSTLKVFGTVRQNCFSPQKFSTLWDKTLFQFSKIWHCESKLLFISKVFRYFERKLNFNSQKFRHWDPICYSSHIFFDVVRQTSKSTFKTFGNVRQKCQSLLEFFNTITQICIWPHTFSDILRQNLNSTLKVFGTVRQNCFSPQNFSTLWDKILIQLSRIWHCESKLLFISLVFRHCERKLKFNSQNIRHWDTNMLFIS